MSDVTDAIMKEVEADPLITATGILLDFESKGLFKKTKTLHIRGSVHSLDQKGRMIKIAQRHAGDTYEVVDHLVVK
jgi:hypothetical protein